MGHAWSRSCWLGWGPVLTPRSLFRPPTGLIPLRLRTSANVHHPEAVVLLTSYRNTGPGPFQDWEAVPHNKMKPASPLSPFPLHLESLRESLVMILAMAYSSASLWTVEATTFRAWHLCHSQTLETQPHADLSAQLCPGDPEHQ